MCGLLGARTSPPPALPASQLPQLPQLWKGLGAQGCLAVVLEMQASFDGAWLTQSTPGKKVNISSPLELL